MEGVALSKTPLGDLREVGSFCGHILGEIGTPPGDVGNMAQRKCKHSLPSINLQH